MKKIVLLIGLPGSGKTTAIQSFGRDQNIHTYDFDQTMPAVLRAKMKSGQIMSDDERDAYFNDVIASIKKLARSKPVIAACVLVKERHKKLFLDALPTALIIKMSVPLEVLKKRLANRKHAFFCMEALEILAMQEESSNLIFQQIDGTLSEMVIVKNIEAILAQ